MRFGCRIGQDFVETRIAILPKESELILIGKDATQSVSPAHRMSRSHDFDYESCTAHLGSNSSNVVEVVLPSRDQAMVKQLQRRLKNWNPDGLCNFHSRSHDCATYDEQGRLIELHLCQLRLTQIPWEVWQFSSLQSLDLSYNQISSLSPEVSTLS